MYCTQEKFYVKFDEFDNLVQSVKFKFTKLLINS